MECTNIVSTRDCVENIEFTSSTNSNILSKIIFNEKNIEVNQKLNNYLHQKLKSAVGLRNYLYNLQNVVFNAFNKNTLMVICNNNKYAVNVYEKYNSVIINIINSTWQNFNINIKYFFIDNGKLVELINNTNFVEKAQSKVLYFNEQKKNQTFENFISSEENSTALEVCQSLACYIEKELVQSGSVVLLYGEESTGKTHLMNSISNFYTSKGGKVLYITATTFLRNYIEAVQKQEVFKFQDDILQNEIIIIEDIDELKGKNGTLLEMQKIVSNAINERKYIVLTSKITPNLLSETNNTLRSILSNAISLKLQSPKEALKMSIAVNYIYEKNFNIPIAVVKGLIENLKCNIRELRNYIKKLAIVQSINKFELNTNFALQILEDDIEKKEKTNVKITNSEIVEKIAEFYNLKKEDIKSKIKTDKICKARNIAMYFMKKVNSANFQEIGREINRNHSTVISGLKNINIWLKTDKKFPAELADIAKKYNFLNQDELF